ncbi:breast cancer anti-estrogen resistance protein 1-like isoform X2 [Ptychodera flava]|uniref:breast cancer anti-estrogen resistance protein 1-like isoform X2 n=1 Tax=Ptychodera flava TaxID=63121 RepID=UPI003969D117
MLRVLAKALYDNLAEAPDELAFRKGDIVTVIEQNTNGLEGWWLCSLNGRQGIAPGNRLKLLAGMYDNPYEVKKTVGLSPQHQPKQQRKSWETAPAKVLIPQRQGQKYYYDSPGNQRHNQQTEDAQEDYDIPPSRYPPNVQMHAQYPQDTYDTPRSMMSKEHPSPSEEVYDVPPIHHQVEVTGPTEIYDVPPSHGYPTEIYDVPPSHQPTMPSTHQPAVPPTHKATVQPTQYPVEIYDVPPSHAVDQGPTEVYDVPPRHDMPSHHGGPKEMNNIQKEPETSIKPTKTTELPKFLEEDYDIPVAYNEQGNQKGEIYDIPPSLKHDQYPQEVYDVPPKRLPNTSNMEVYDVPKSMGNLSGNEYDEDYSDYVYDVPPQVTKDRQDGVIGSPATIIKPGMDKLDAGMKQMSIGSSKTLPGRELNIDLDAAMDLLVKLQQRVDSSVTHLLSFVGSSWRRRSSLEPKIYEIKGACYAVKALLSDFVEFSRGAAINSAKATDHNLQRKLKSYLQPLENTLATISKSLEILDDMDWQVTKLCLTESLKTPDDLDHIVMCARSMPEDVRQLASIIHGNSTLIFKRARQNSSSPVQSRPLPTPPGSKGNSPKHSPTGTGSPMGTLKQQKPSWIKTEAERDTSPSKQGKEKVQARPLPYVPGDTLENLQRKTNKYGKGWLDDYDYVHLEGREAFERRQKELLQKGDAIKQEQLQQQQQRQFEELEKEATKPVNSDSSEWTPPKSNRQSLLGVNDKHLLTFYADQMDSLITSLNNAIDAFYSAIDSNQPPKIFVAHGKFVILSAHKLVFIGDTLYRSIDSNDIRNKVMHSTDLLCECLKVTVGSIKTAALEYPAIHAMQEMVDRIMDISQASQDLKRVICQFAAL